MYVYIFSPKILFPAKNSITDPTNNSPDKCPKLLLKKGNEISLYSTAFDFSKGERPIQTFRNLDEYHKYLETQNKNGSTCPILYLQQENDTQGKDVYKIRPSPFEPNDGVSINPQGYFSFESIASYLEGGGDASATATTKIEGFDTSVSGNTTVDPSSSSTVISGNAVATDASISPVYSPSTSYSTSVPNYSADVTVSSPPSPPTPPPKEVVQIKDASREDQNYNAGQYAGFDPSDLYVGVYTNIDQIHNSTSTQKISDNPMDDNWGGVLYTQNAINTGKYEENNVFKPNYYTPKNGMGYANA